MPYSWMEDGNGGLQLGFAMEGTLEAGKYDVFNRI